MKLFNAIIDSLKRSPEWCPGLLFVIGSLIILAGVLDFKESAPYISGAKEIGRCWPHLLVGLAFYIASVGYEKFLYTRIPAVRPTSDSNSSRSSNNDAEPTQSTSHESNNRTTFSTREDKQHYIEAHVAGLCFRYTGSKLQLLIGHRTKNRKLLPGYWECGGGQVHIGENFEEALIRQHFEEFGIRVRILRPMATYEIMRPNDPKIPGLVFLCVSVDNGNEGVVLNEREFSEFRWVTENQCKQFNLIPGMPKQVTDAFALAKEHWKFGKATSSNT